VRTSYRSPGRSAPRTSSRRCGHDISCAAREAVLQSFAVAAHSLPASELPTGPRRGGDEDKGL
jgi:hypothetical protein